MSLQRLGRGGFCRCVIRRLGAERDRTDGKEG